MNRALRVGLELSFAAALSLLAAAVLTWPMIMHWDEVIVGGGELGGWLWRYWWHFTEVDALAEGDLPLWETVYTWLSLGRHPETGNILDVLLVSWPLSKFFGLPASYNLKVLIVLVGDGVCGYVLARHLTQSRAAACAAAVVAVVNPLVIQDVHGSGLRQVVLWWVLLFPVLLDRAERTKRWHAGLLAGACLGMAGAWYWFYGLFAGMYLGVWGVDWLIRERKRMDWRRQVPWVVPTVGAAFLVAGLFVLPYAIGEGGGEVSGAQKALPELSFFLTFPEYDVIRDVPLRPSTYEENVLSSLNRTIMSSWSVDYLFNPSHPRGLPLMVFLFGVCPAALMRPGLFVRSRFWLVVFGVFWLGTLGPFLKFGGDVDSSEVLTWGEYVIRLPYTLMFKFVPGMSRMFAPYRMGSMVAVASVALVALGISRAPQRWLRVVLALVGIVGAGLQVTYRWEIGPVPDDAFLPSMWRAPTKVSVMQVPDWYKELPDEQAGLIELPLEQQQDLLTWYQVEHGWKVYRSWATRPAVPAPFRDEGGGKAGEQLRYLAKADPDKGSLPEALMALSRDPAEVEVEDLSPDALARLCLTNGYRYIVVHERGYYLVDPLRGNILYDRAVSMLRTHLGLEAEEHTEMAWFDYPGNEYKVPDGPVYVPWSSQEVSLPDREMPNRYFMATFDLQPLVDAYDGPLPSEETDVPEGPVHNDMQHEEREHKAAAPGAQ
jgi:hypothetical protein